MKNDLLQDEQEQYVLLFLVNEPCEQKPTLDLMSKSVWGVLTVTSSDSRGFSKKT